MHVRHARLSRLVRCVLPFSALFIACTGRDTNPAAPSANAATPPASPAPATSPALENVHDVFPGLISGGEPAGDAGFTALADRGIRTIISVDGATPDVDRAAARGMRYVHVPIGYNGLTRDEELTIARAVRDLPKPIYIHCHHGKHRGPAAAATAGVILGQLSPDQGTAFLARAGTSRNYPGLWKCVGAARPVATARLDRVPPDLPPVARVSNFTEAMSAVDRTWDNLQSIAAAQWQTPPDHPDLVPAAEAARLADLFRTLRDDPHLADEPAAFGDLLGQAAEASAALERDLVNQLPPASLDQRFARLDQNCRTCHAQFRDQP